MRRLTGRYRTLVLAALLITMVVPRCLMAAEMAWLSGEIKTSHQPPCHTSASLESIQAGNITCALQCEQSLLTSLTAEKSVNAPDPGHAIIVSAWPAFVLVTPVSPHQGWPPDNQIFLSNHQSLYLETGRLRL